MRSIVFVMYFLVSEGLMMLSLMENSVFMKKEFMRNMLKGFMS